MCYSSLKRYEPCREHSQPDLILLPSFRSLLSPSFHGLLVSSHPHPYLPFCCPSYLYSFMHESEFNLMQSVINATNISSFKQKNVRKLYICINVHFKSVNWLQMKTNQKPNQSLNQTHMCDSYTKFASFSEILFE